MKQININKNKIKKVKKEEKTMKNIKLFVTSLTVVIMMMVFTSSASAANTAAGTTISNDVTLTYYVGGVLQTTQNLAVPYTFVVDNKVDLTVVNNLNANVIPGSTNQAVGFQVTNTGNSTQRYALAVETDAAGANIPMNPSPPNIYIDLGVVGTYEGGIDVLYVDASTAGDIAPGGVVNVLIVADTPLAAVNGNVDTYNLLATTVDAGGLGVTAESVGDTAGVDVVFADEFGLAAGPHSGDVVEGGNASAQGTFTVSSVTLTVAKTSTVISDPINGTTNPIAIPGAVVQYQVTVTHTAGASNATNVTISDDLSSEIGAGTLIINAQHSGGVCIATEGTTVNINGGGAVCQSNVADGDFGDITGSTVTATGITLTPGGNAVLTFEVTIQ